MNVIVMSDTRVDPRTVMIHLHHTLVAEMTMMCSHRLDAPARVAIPIRLVRVPFRIVEQMRFTFRRPLIIAGREAGRSEHA